MTAMRHLALALLLAACGGTDPATGARCEIGRTQACPCPGGAQGAQGSQECGLAGVYGACVCAAPDAGTDAGADAPSDVAAPTDAAPEVGADAPGVDAPVQDVTDAAPDASSPTDAPSDVPPDANPCPMGQTLCGILGEPNACRDLRRGVLMDGMIYSCGACNNACSVGLSCVLGRCQ